MKKNFFICFMAMLLFSLPAMSGEKLTGTVIGISDGDTLTILTPEKEQIKIRLAGIDAPEKTQPYGQKSKQILSDEVFDQTVEVETKELDKYGRTIGYVFLGEKNINLKMITQGGAWAYRQYLSPQDASFIEAESQARLNKIGLWSLQEDQILPPWEFRRRNQVQPKPANDNASYQKPIIHKSCCKQCSKGIPCGDSCISASKTCRKPAGCAC